MDIIPILLIALKSHLSRREEASNDMTGIMNERNLTKGVMTA